MEGIMPPSALIAPPSARRGSALSFWKSATPFSSRRSCRCRCRCRCRGTLEYGLG